MRSYYPILIGIALLLPFSQTARADQAGVRVRIEVFEILDADPPETAIIDSVTADILFDRETTLRAGNFVLFLTAAAADADAVQLQYSLFPLGTAASPKFDDARVEYETPLIVSDIPGKGKSAYRSLITPYPALVPPAPALEPSDTSGWRSQPGTFYVHHAAPYSLADFHYPQLHSILDGEYGAMRDTFALRSPGRMSVYLIEGRSSEFPYDSRFDFAVDPARNRIAARYDYATSGIDTQALLLLSLYRHWGYAPDLLALGASGYLSFADYDVVEDRAKGIAIPLDSLVRACDFKRYNQESALDHAASFVGWLIHTGSMNTFRELYQRATDLSLERALWAGYGKTLAELEAEWLDYLSDRVFRADEFARFAVRARYYRRPGRHLTLLERGAASSDTVMPGLWHDLSLAQGHTGQWEKTAATLRTLIAYDPAFVSGYALLGEALWAQGDWVHAALVLKDALALDSTLVQAYMRLGDIQADRRRVDSAAVLWQRGLYLGGGPIVTANLNLRVGRYERSRGKPELAAEHFRTALQSANQALGSDAANPTAWLLIGASYLNLDSIDIALEHLDAAYYLADAPVDVALIHIYTGACYDLAGQRDAALRQYEKVFTMPAPYMNQKTARRYINAPYGHGEAISSGSGD
jgi:tetratricopeptide (TPR) repeat protein